MALFHLIPGSVILLSIAVVAYLAVVSESARLSNILMALGLTCEAVAFFAQTAHTSKIASLFGLAFIIASMILLIRMIYSRRRSEV